jgi:uncharacterized protein YegP (UPF0339 family)
MSGKNTRVSLGEAVEGDLTDWARVRALTDDEIEQAIRDDPDTFAMADGDVPPVRGLIFKDPQGLWRWRLIAPTGEAIADSPRGYSDRGEVDRAIRALRTAIVADEAKAA